MSRACVFLNASVGMLTVQGWRQEGVILSEGVRGEEKKEGTKQECGRGAGEACGFQKAKLSTFLIVS